MKKTLVAMAVLAVSGASFAQVTITGQVQMQYDQGRNATGNETSGFGVDTSVINFNATEDLGGGMKIEGQLGLDGVNRANSAGTFNGAAGTSTGTATAGDAFIKLTTSVGRFDFGNYRFADYMTGTLLAGMGVGMDAKVFNIRPHGESIGFTTKLGPVFVGLSQTEADYRGLSAFSASVASGGTQAGSAGIATSTGQRTNSLSITYPAGPLVANLNYLSYDSNNVVNGSNTVIRGALTYDFGMAKVGASLSSANPRSATSVNENSSVTDMALAVSVPLGAATLSANYASRKLANTGCNATTVAACAGFGHTAANISQVETTNAGQSIKLDYALSKRTGMGVSYAKWQARAANFLADTTDTTLISTWISHSF